MVRGSCADTSQWAPPRCEVIFTRRGDEWEVHHAAMVPSFEPSFEPLQKKPDRYKLRKYDWIHIQLASNVGGDFDAIIRNTIESGHMPHPDTPDYVNVCLAPYSLVYNSTERNDTPRSLERINILLREVSFRRSGCVRKVKMEYNPDMHS